MHTRRVATFLLGAWLGGSVLMILIQAANLHFTDALLSAPSDQAAAFLKHAGSPQDLAAMLRYQAAEQNRRYDEVWQDVQFGLAVILAAALFLGTQRRIFPLAICGLMLLVLIFQRTVVSPELSFRGRATDFPVENAPSNALLRVSVMRQVYGWVEGTKLLLGIVLAGYLFIFRVPRNRQRTDLPDALPRAHGTRSGV